jgi:hypothetical protein
MTTDLEPVSLIGPDGQPTAEARYNRELPAETLCWLYAMMVVTRDLDSEFVNLQRQGLPLPGTAGGGRGSFEGAAARRQQPCRARGYRNYPDRRAHHHRDQHHLQCRLDLRPGHWNLPRAGWTLIHPGNLAHNAPKEQTWQSMLMPPTGN